MSSFRGLKLNCYNHIFYLFIIKRFIVQESTRESEKKFHNRTKIKEGGCEDFESYKKLKRNKNFGKGFREGRVCRYFYKF